MINPNPLITCHCGHVAEQGTVEIVGIHNVVADMPCALIELVIYDSLDPSGISLITQAIEGQPESNWQVPYDEKLLSEAGDAIACDLFLRPPETWPAVARVAFFFHDLRPDQPLETPWGAMPLPTPSPLPDRLAFLGYEAP